MSKHSTEKKIALFERFEDRLAKVKVIVCDNFFRLSGESKIKQEKGRGCKFPPILFTADGNADRTGNSGFDTRKNRC